MGDVFNFPGGNHKIQNEGFPVDIKFGEIGSAINCAVCNGFSNAGFFVIYKDKARLSCVKCIAGAISKYQELHPDAKLLEFDIDVDKDGYKAAADAIRGKYPEFSESKALEIAELAIRSI